MKQDDVNLNGLLMFGQNIEYLRSSLLKLTYSQISECLEIPQPTLVFYSRGVAPGLCSAVKMAAMYGVPLERLCAYPISSDIEEEVKISRSFLFGMYGSSFESCSDECFLRVMENVFSGKDSVSLFDLFVNLLDTLSSVAKLRLYVSPLKKPVVPDCAVSFTNSFSYLIDSTRVSYRQISAACDIAIGNLSRLKAGAEPKLSVVIRLADFFGVSLTDLLSEGRGIDLLPVCVDLMDKTFIENRSSDVPDKVVERQQFLKGRMCDKSEAETLLRAALTCHER